MIIKPISPPRTEELPNQEQRYREEVSRRVSQPKLSELPADPTTPFPGDVWIRNLAGVYTICYRTEAGTTVRAVLA